MQTIGRYLKPLSLLLMTLAAITQPAAAQQARILYFPQFGNGGGFASDLVIYNPSARTAVSGEVLAWDEDGNPLANIPMTGVALSARSSVEGTSFVLEPQGSITFVGMPEANQVLGSAAISSDGLVSGVVRFHIPDIGIAGVGSAEPALSLIAPVRREGALDTGVAVRNVHIAPVDVTLTLLDETGSPVPGGTTVLEGLPPNARVARFIAELFPDAETSGFRGSLSVRPSEGKLAAVALELGTNPGEFTTLPVSPLDAVPPDFGDLSGTWAGTTAQGLPFSFTVSGGRVTSFEGSITIQGMGCSSTSSISGDIPVSIFENSFIISACADIFFSFSDRIGGVFTSATTAEGTWSSIQSTAFFPGDCTGSGETTWSVVRQ